MKLADALLPQWRTSRIAPGRRQSRPHPLVYVFGRFRASHPHPRLRQATNEDLVGTIRSTPHLPYRLHFEMIPLVNERDLPQLTLHCVGQPTGATNRPGADPCLPQDLAKRDC